MRVWVRMMKNSGMHPLKTYQMVACNSSFQHIQCSYKPICPINKCTLQFRSFPQFINLSVSVYWIDEKEFVYWIDEKDFVRNTSE
ncbi:hypothetical protein Scep_020865 [Stephania cephalantha]|uniref:Uncharacterized protein n=1 Tax=Stephania cephalantha TaxID=152367 RepID=A0AAP0F3I1_9MAGN